MISERTHLLHYLGILLMTTQVIAQGSLLLVGGGGEDYNSWSDQPYGWFVARADSGKIINIDVIPRCIDKFRLIGKKSPDE